MFRFLFVLTFLLIASPISVYASVTINEIAWMGDAESANHEWIELYNSGSEAIDLTGWVLSDGANLDINLTGSAPASSYVVLERTSDESSSASAFLIYTGALVNTGATLTLRNINGDIMDQVAGGEEWKDVGGDNISKETAQYTSGGWVTNIATPGIKNKLESTEVKEVKDAEVADRNSDNDSPVVNPVSKSKSGSTKSVSLVSANTELKLSADMHDVAYVNQNIPFTVKASGIGENIINSLVYTWNFGDSYIASGKNVNHSYDYPGTYVVTINAKYARHDETIRKEIKVLPVAFSITENERGDIQIHNDSPYDVDVSGFVIRGINNVVLPPQTIILPKATITIAKKRLGLNDSNTKLVILSDVRGDIVASNFLSFKETSGISEKNSLGEDETSFIPLVNSGVIKNSIPPTTSIKPEVSDILGEFNAIALADEGQINLSGGDITPIKTGLVSKNDYDSERWPYVVFACLILLSLFGLYLSKR
jgi:hypothetical protein